MRRLNFTILTGCNSTSILTVLQSCNYLAVESLARLRREPDEDVGWGSLLLHTYYTEFHLSLVQHIGLETHRIFLLPRCKFYFKKLFRSIWIDVCNCIETVKFNMRSLSELNKLLLSNRQGGGGDQLGVCRVRPD